MRSKEHPEERTRNDILLKALLTHIGEKIKALKRYCYPSFRMEVVNWDYAVRDLEKMTPMEKQVAGIAYLKGGTPMCLVCVFIFSLERAHTKDKGERHAQRQTERERERERCAGTDTSVASLSDGSQHSRVEKKKVWNSLSHPCWHNADGAPLPDCGQPAFLRPLWGGPQ